MTPLLFLALVAAAAPEDCDRFFAAFSDVDDGSDWRYRPGASCEEAINTGAVDVDAVITALPKPAQARAVCRLGSPALSPLRLSVVDDAALSVRDRGRCLARLVVDANDEAAVASVVSSRAFLTDAESERPRVSPVVLSAAHLMIDDVTNVTGAPPDAAEVDRRRALFAPTLHRALSDRALDRWTLGATLCTEHNPPGLDGACTDVKNDQAAAKDDVRATVSVVGGAVTAAAAVAAATVYVVPAVLLHDTLLAIPLGALGGSFFGAVVGGAAGVAIGVVIADLNPSPRAEFTGITALVIAPFAVLADLFEKGLVVVAATLVGVVAGVVVFGVAGGVAASIDGAPRVIADVAGAVGVGSVVVALAVPVIWGIADERDPRE